MQKITTLTPYQELHKAYPQLNEKKLLKVVAAVNIFISVAAQDRKITKEELGYLKRYTRYFFTTEKPITEKIVKYLAISFKDSKEYRASTPYCLTYLIQNLNKEEKEEFIATLFVIARSDLEITEIEKNFIRKICSQFGFPEEFFQSELIKASLILARKQIDEVISDLETQKDEFNEYEVMSARDYYQMMNNPK